jgi:hypothetical protein
MEDSVSTIIITIVRSQGTVNYKKAYTNIGNADILFVAEMLREEVLQEIKNDIKARATSKNVVSEHKEMD